MSFFTDSNNNFNSGLSFETGDSEEKILSNTLEIIKQLTKKDAVWVCDPSIERGAVSYTHLTLPTIYSV